MGAVVNSTEPMRRMRVVVTTDRAVDTLSILQVAGVLHAEQSSELKPADRDAIEREMREVSELRTTIGDALKHVDSDRLVRVERDVDVFLTRPLAEIAGETRTLCTRLGAMHRQEQKIREEREALEERRQVAEELAARMDLTTADFDFSGAYLFSRLIAVRKEACEAPGKQLAGLSLVCGVVERGEEVYVFLVGETGSRAAVERWVIARGARFLAVPGTRLSLGEFVAHAGTESERLDAEAARLRAAIERQTEDNLEMLLLLREALVSGKQRLEVLEKACEARYVTLFEGWVPVKAVETVSGELEDRIGFVYVESRPPRSDEEPPSKLRNFEVLRPFEVVVNLFGTPKYGEWDPTPVVGYFFAFFFGIMLGDAVYGLLLLLLARFFLARLVEDPEAEGFLMFRRLLYICAGSAIVVGLLTGAYLGDFLTRFFGAPNLAVSKAVQAVYLDPMAIIVVSLFIGLVHVNFGHLLMLIRGVRERNVSYVLGRSGIFLLQLAAIPLLLRFLGIELLPFGEAVYSALSYLLPAAVVVIIAASLIEKGPFLGSILWVFDISGILGDVMSYARLAGVGLATYYLAYCFNLMSVLIAELLPEGILRLVFGSLIIVAVLVFGHLLNLVLSSITCFVHSLRLTFVEFLFKFYEGGGRAYSPFRLRRRELIPVRAGG